MNKKIENKYFIVLKLYREATGFSTLRACPIVNVKPKYSLQERVKPKNRSPMVSLDLKICFAHE